MIHYRFKQTAEVQRRRGAEQKGSRGRAATSRPRPAGAAEWGFWVVGQFEFGTQELMKSAASTHEPGAPISKSARSFENKSHADLEIGAPFLSS